MKTLIAYAGKYGKTAEYAAHLANRMEGETHLLDLMGDKPYTPSQYDRVIVGSGVYYGRILKQAAHFLEQAVPQAREIGMFLCCCFEEKQQEYWAGNVSEELLERIKVRGCFPGKVDQRKIKGLSKLVVKLVAKSLGTAGDVAEDAQQRAEEALDVFVESWRLKN
ncbi:MAG: flavodoxin domain-containing protein [Christensenellales bacterium]|jgi:menaquinone-dependent protoporphyrinogen oxidase